MKTKLLQIIVVAILLLTQIENAFGTKYYVKTTGNDANNGLSWATPFKSISHAINVSTDNDIINVLGGTYIETSLLMVLHKITIVGVGTCIVNGQDVSGTGLFAGEYLRISNFVFKNINADYAPLTFFAGGWLSGITVQDSHSQDPNSSYAGGLYLINTYWCTNKSELLGVTVKNCYCGYGDINAGAINIVNSDPVFPLNIWGLSALGNIGSGIMLTGMTQNDELNNIISKGNTGYKGAGINCSYCPYVKINNALISGNILGGNNLPPSYDYKGAGIFFTGVPNSTLELNSSTIAGNKGNKFDQGQAIYMGDYCYLKIKNSIVYYNKNAFDYGFAISVMNSNYLDVTYSCEQFGDWTSGNIASNPMFVNPIMPEYPNVPNIAGDYHLLANSPCINTGDPATAGIPGYVTYDLDNQARINNGIIDMGCYEFGKSGGGISLKNIESEQEKTLPVKNSAYATVAPNPITTASKIKFNCADDQVITISLYKINGELLTRHNCGLLKTGTYEYELSDIGFAKNLSGGTYILKISGSEINQVIKILKR